MGGGGGEWETKILITHYGIDSPTQRIAYLNQLPTAQVSLQAGHWSGNCKPSSAVQGQTRNRQTSSTGSILEYENDKQFKVQHSVVRARLCSH